MSTYERTGGLLSLLVTRRLKDNPLPLVMEKHFRARRGVEISGEEHEVGENIFTHSVQEDLILYTSSWHRSCRLRPMVTDLKSAWGSTTKLSAHRFSHDIERVAAEILDRERISRSIVQERYLNKIKSK